MRPSSLEPLSVDHVFDLIARGIFNLIIAFGSGDNTELLVTCSWL